MSRQEIDEIFKIFRVLGTPTEETWPGVHELPDFKDAFPKWAPRPLKEVPPFLPPHLCYHHTSSSSGRYCQ